MDIFEIIQSLFYRPKKEETKEIEIPKVKYRPRRPSKKKLIEKRGRKPKPSEENKTKRLYKENIKKQISIFEVNRPLIPEEPPFWFYEK